MDDNYKTPLIVEAIRMAARNVTFADDAVFHSDYAEPCVKPRNRVLASDLRNRLRACALICPFCDRVVPINS
jgi:hypothetical protein